MFEKLWPNFSSCQNWAYAVAASMRCAIGSNYQNPIRAFRLGFLKRCIAFAEDRRGVSAVEFALLLPLMVTVYFGTVQLSQGIGIYGKVSSVSSTVANLATQFSTIANADMSNILAASSTIVAPYATNVLAVTVSGVTIDKNGKATIAWSDTVGGAARPVGQVIPLCGIQTTLCIPSALAVASTFLVWGESQYAYTPPIGAAIMGVISLPISGTITLKDQIFMSPRISSTITRVNS